MSALPDRSTRPFDVVVWGATGFTGRLVCEHLASLGPGVTWAMAGRNRSKLEAIRAEIAASFPAAKDAPLLVGDASDPVSLTAITAQARAICATVGPFALHGEPIVAACVKTATDYCDSTGEPHFIRRIIDAHHEAARAAGVRLVPTCGFDSVPSDLGAFVLAEHARREHHRALSEVRAYVISAMGGVSGGTAHTMIALLDAATSDRALRRLLADPYALSPDRARDIDADGWDDLTPRWDGDAGGWAAPWVMASINSRVVRRSNALFDHRYGKRFRYRESMLMKGRVAGAAKALALAAAMGTTMAALAASTPLRRWAETKLPAPGQGPSREKRESGFFKMRFYAVLENDSRPTLLARCEGKGDPGYAATSRMLAQSALSLAKDPPIPGFESGVLTPATALGMHLVERLQAVDIRFDISEI